jgi:hypothetical protein
MRAGQSLNVLVSFAADFATRLTRNGRQSKASPRMTEQESLSKSGFRGAHRGWLAEATHSGIGSGRSLRGVDLADVPNRGSRCTGREFRCLN